MTGMDFDQVRKFGMDVAAADAKALLRMRRVIQAGAMAIKRDAQIGAPVDTGNLRNSISYDTQTLANSVRAEIGPTAEYAPYVEEGTSKMEPQPFLGPAFDRNLAAIEEAAVQASIEDL